MGNRDMDLGRDDIGVRIVRPAGTADESEKNKEWGFNEIFFQAILR